MSKVDNGGKIHIEPDRFQFCSNNSRPQPHLSHTVGGEFRHGRDGRENLLEPVHAPAFVIDRQKGLASRHRPQMQRQFIGLVEAFDIPLKEMEAAGLDVAEKGRSLLIRLVALKSKDKQLAYLLFQSEALRIPHWRLGSIQLF